MFYIVVYNCCTLFTTSELLFTTVYHMHLLENVGEVVTFIPIVFLLRIVTFVIEIIENRMKTTNRT